MFSIKQKTWDELQSWARIAYEKDKNEISGLLIAMPDNEGNHELIFPDILKQENSGTSTELNAEAVQEWSVKMKMKLDRMPRYKGRDFRYVWWHSHHTMGAFWSGTDLKEIEAWGEMCDFSIALVINLKEEYLLRVSYWKPIEVHQDVELEIIKPKTTKESKNMLEKYEKLCSDKSNVITNYGGYQRMNNQTWGNQTHLWNGSAHSVSADEVNQSLIKEYKEFIVQLDTLKDDIDRQLLTRSDWVNKCKKINSELASKKKPFKIDKKFYKGNFEDEVNMLFDIDDMVVFKSDDIENTLKEDNTYGWMY